MNIRLRQFDYQLHRRWCPQLFLFLMFLFWKDLSILPLGGGRANKFNRQLDNDISIKMKPKHFHQYPLKAQHEMIEIVI